MAQESENNKKLQAFFDEEYQSLKSYVGSKIQDSVSRDAEDIIQDVALKLFSGADGYSSINNVASFVYRSVKNKIIDIMRKGRESDYSAEVNESQLNDFTELLYGPSDNTYSEAQVEELKSLIGKLQPNYRDIILAVDFEGYSYKELEEEWGVPAGTLMSRRHRAVAILSKQLRTNTTLKHTDDELF